MAIFFRQNKARSRLFKKATQGHWHFSLALIFSLCLIFFDRTGRIALVHRAFASLVYPLQSLTDAPHRLFLWSRVFWESKQALLDEIQLLSEAQLHTEAALQQLSALQNENALLSALLGVSKQFPHRMLVARTLALDTRKTRHLLMINKGKQDGLKPGQLVLDTSGVTGQIIDVGTMSSTVLLISDAASAVPVRNQRTGETAILAGTNDPEHLSLIYLPKTVSVMKGDLLVTSGLGGSHPENYPVGTVEAVTHPPGEAFIRVDVKPFTQYHHDRFVLLVWPNENI